jgi:hypothetical protein
VLSSLVRLVRDSLRTVGWEKVSTRLGVALLVVSAIFFAANFADKVWLSYQFAQAKQQRLAEIADAKRQIYDYQHQLAYLHSRTFYVQEARRYGYVQPGDYQLQVTVQDAAPDAAPPPAAPSTPPVPKHHESWLHRLLQAVVPGI